MEKKKQEHRVGCVDLGGEAEGINMIKIYHSKFSRTNRKTWKNLFPRNCVDLGLFFDKSGSTVEHSLSLYVLIFPQPIVSVKAPESQNLMAEWWPVLGMKRVAPSVGNPNQKGGITPFVFCLHKTDGQKTEIGKGGKEEVRRILKATKERLLIWLVINSGWCYESWRWEANKHLPGMQLISHTLQIGPGRKIKGPIVDYSWCVR